MIRSRPLFLRLFYFKRQDPGLYNTRVPVEPYIGKRREVIMLDVEMIGLTIILFVGLVYLIRLFNRI